MVILFFSNLTLNAQIAPIETFKGMQHVYLDGHWRTMGDDGEFVIMEDSVITVKYKSTADSATKAIFQTTRGLTYIRKSDAGYIDYSCNPDSVFKIVRYLDTASIVEFTKLNYLCKLLSDPVIPRCEPDDYYYVNSYLTHLDFIMAPEMWYLLYCGPDPIENCHPIVAVIDNGLDINHPDLGLGADAYENINKIAMEDDWSNAVNPFSGNNVDNGANTFIDDWKGWDFTGTGGNLAGDNDVKFDNNGNAGNDVLQHGTKVAGIIGAKTYNGIGVSGVAGGWDNVAGAQIMPINIDEGPGYMLGSVVNDAIEYARKNGARVINMSFKIPFAGNGPDVEAELSAAHNEGMIIIAASGNEDNVNGQYAIRYPASSKYAISVGSTNNSDIIMPYSCYIGAKPLDLVAPHADYSTYDPTTYHSTPDGTSYSAPLVSGTVANMICVNDCMSTEWARDILHVTSDKVTAIYNAPDVYPAGFNQKFGFGRLNAYKAVKLARKLHDAHLTSDEDLYMKDCPDDMGFIGPDYACITVTDASPDIWVRPAPDGFTFDEMMDVEPVATNYVYVRVRNISCVPSTLNRVLNVYWSKAATWTSWPQNWNGTIPSLGNFIGTIYMPVIQSGQVMTFELPWTVPTYLNIAGTWTPFCILARLEDATGDVITGNVSSVELNNNVTIRNTGCFGIGNQIIGNSISDEYFYPLGGHIDIVNPIDENKLYDFHFKSPAVNNGNILTDVAEVTVIFDDDSWSAFDASGSLSQTGVTVVQDKEIKITQNNVVFENVELPADSRFTTFVGVKFLIDSFTTEKTYNYLVAQSYADSSWYVGGENLAIKRSNRIPFDADAGADQSVFASDTVTLTGALVNEDVIYKWYKGTAFKHTGRIYKSIADAGTFTLQVTSVADATVDYDNVAVNLKSGVISSVYPNPVTTTATVTYAVSDVNNATLVLVHPFYLVVGTYPLTTSSTSYNLDMSAIGTGTYSLLLICDGNIQDVKTVVKY